jgi:hypothetical protein
MRIIGGHDYYDSGLAWGQDNAHVFVRSESYEIVEEDFVKNYQIPNVLLSEIVLGTEKQKYCSVRQSDDYTINRKDRKISFKVAKVILCGVLYRGYRIEDSSQKYYMHDTHVHWIWTAEAFRKYLEENDLETREIRSGVEKMWSSQTRKLEDVPVLSVDDWFKPEKLSGDCLKAILDNRITIMTFNPGKHYWNKPRWDVNGSTLGEMEFAKAVDPYSAFQEISMWIGGVLPSDGNKIVEITDNKVKIEKHGFHHPTSFRREKSKK